MNDATAAEGSGPWPAWPWLVLAAGWLLWRTQSGPGVWDAGELVAAAVTLGGSHPPGQPLHALLGYAVSLVPLGSMTLRVAWLSALGELGAAWLMVQTTRRVFALRWNTKGHFMSELAAHVAGISCLLAAPMWRQASRVEVYGLGLLLFVASLERMLAWIDGSRRALREAALWAGLAAAVHPPHALAAVAVGAVFLLALRRQALPHARGLLWATVAFLLGLSCYVYLPLRAWAGATLWGDPTTVAGFLSYVSAAAYRGNLGSGDAQRLEVVGYMLSVAGPAAITGAALLLAIALTGRRDTPRETWALVLLPVAAASAGLLQALQIANPDNVAYDAPAVAALIAVGAATLAGLPLTRYRESVLGLALLSFLAVPVLRADLESSGRADDPALETLAGELTDVPPPRALVVLRHDFAGSAFMLARAADGARPDVALLIEGLATSSWHWRSLRSHPLFDGLPVRGRASDPRDAWVNGAVVRAAGHVAVVSEDDGPLAERGAVAGPYLAIAASADEAPTPRWTSCFAERLEPELGREAAAASASDADVVAGVLRQEALTRARRLLARRLPEPAGVAYRRALTSLPERMRAIVDHLGAPRMSAPPVIRDPTAMLPSAGDAVREAATSVLVAGDPVQALQLLEWGEQHGDARSLLQFAVFEWARGAIPEARAALEAFETAAPALRAEGDDLREQLDHPPAPSPDGSGE